MYLKSAGSYENANEYERDNIICDENGFAETKMLPYGTYVVHQTKGWENTENMEDFEVNICENEKNYSYIINDAVITSFVKIVKKDAETGKVIPVSGIGFKVWDCKNSCYISQKISYPSEMTIETFYTDETGTLMLPQELVYGSYELHEVQSAHGYVLDKTPVSFTIDGTVETVVVEKTNIPQKGRISVQKSGDIFSSVTALGSAVSADGEKIERPTIYNPVFEEKGLAGAVFQVIASEDIVTADGTVRANVGDVVAEITTDENGYAQTDLLYLGKYEVKEISAPYGYVLNSEPQIAELTYAGQEVTVRDTVNTMFINDYQSVEISLEKLMENDERFNIYGKDSYTSVRFGLFAAEEIIAADGNSIPENGLVAEVSLDENMKAVIAEKVPFGKYYVLEIATDEKYILNGEKYLVSFEYQGQEMTTVYIDCGQFVNDLKRGKIKGLKVNESDEPLEDAVFGLYFADCTEFGADNAIMSASTDAKGNFSFENIPFGEYIVHEIFPPTGYVYSDESYPVTITEDGDVVEIKAVNNKIKGNVTVTKIDEEYPDNKLSGAEFTVYSDEKCENEIDVLTETEKGVYTLSYLEYGQYFLKETVAPDGFIIDENVYPFSIETDGETVEISNTEVGNGFVNKPEEGSIEITKTDISTGELIPNCGIEILDKDGNVIVQGRTDETGVVKFEKLRTGEYFYREFDAPDGYILDETKYPFTIKENDEIVKCEMTNTKLPQTPPHTGDISNNIPAFVMLGLSAAIAATLCILKFKKGKKNEK